MIESPFNLTKAKLKSVNGRVSRNLPPIANKIAKIISTNIVRNLTPFDILFGEILDHHFNKKYIKVKITSIKIIKFI